MAIHQAPLPYNLSSLEPYMSKETLEFHYGKHHKTYFEKTNELVLRTRFDQMNLEEIILESYDTRNKKLFNNAAQAWNHTFFWNCLTGAGHEEPSADLKGELEKYFGSVEKFKEQFTAAAFELFGSGWVWLIKDTDGCLRIINMSNALNPLINKQIPLFTCDVWEHAYYIDCRNEKPKYLRNFWRLVNWRFIELNLEQNAKEQPIYSNRNIRTEKRVHH